MDKFKRGGINNVLIKLDTVYKTNTGFKGINGQDLVLGDEQYSKERHANTSGTVIQLPLALSKRPLSSIKPGFPGYGAIRLPENADVDINPVFYSIPISKYKFINDIVPEIEIGDTAYFQWQSVFDKRHLIAESADKKSFIFKVPYELIYTVVRKGTIIPIGSNVLIDPIMESWESIFKPTYWPFLDHITQKPKVRPKKDWIQIKIAPKQIDRQGIIKHIGTPLKGDTCALKAGMRVLYKPNLKSLLDIEGEKYFIMRQDQILCYQA